MATRKKIILSASRRTDIPAFYMPWFMDGIEKARFEVINPYNQQVSIVPAGADQVHTIVFWSKDFGPFLYGNYGEELIARGYHLFFNFTVNTPDRLLEPNVPALGERIEQMAALGRRFGPQVINWRFDPLCFYTTAQAGSVDNRGAFEMIAGAAARLGVQRCVTSFMDDYAKVRRRAASLPGFSFIDPPHAKKVSICLAMARALAVHKVSLQLCCEKEVLAGLPDGSGIKREVAFRQTF